MPGPATALAKLTPPRLYAITRRKRLFTLIDEKCRHHSLVWIAGPPGAGKTSLIASYLAEQKQRTLWYHIDPGDADLATFFHYLAKAAQTAAGRKRVTLPLLTPEFLGDVQAFTRRFFRELWSKVPSPAVLVLDNYQNIASSAMLHQILPVALSEFPVDTTLMAISREAPPRQFAREQTHNWVGHITWEDLRLTFEETISLAGSTSGMTQDLLRTLHEKANGWMAGTVLMLERFKTQRTFHVANPPEKRTHVFHYFADEVFEMMISRERDVLMRTALLPWVTAPMSVEVSDDSAAAEVLRDLYRRGLFVDRRTDERERYQYHDLFREFLLERGRIHFDEDNLHRFKRTAAQVAEKYRQHDTAVALYAETHSWDELAELIRANAEQLLAQGRHQTVQRYMGLFPHAEREKRPWLLYWSGTTQLLFDPIAARKDLEAAYQQFELSQQDIAGLLLTCSGIIDSYMCGVDDMAPTIVWGDRLQQILHQSHGFPSPQVEARVLSNLQGLIYASPHHPFLDELEASLDRLLYSLDDPASRCGVVATFVNLPLWRGDFRRVRQMLDQLLPYMESALIPPGIRLCWNVMEANHAWNVRHHDQAKENLALAFEIAEEFGILVHKPMILGISAYNALAAGDDQEGERLADLLAAMIQPHHRLGQGQCSFYRAGVALLRNDLSSALHHATSALNTTASLCLPFMTANCRVGLAKVLVELGELVKAREQLDVALEYARTMRSSTIEVHCLLTLAQMFIKEGQLERGDELLQRGLRSASHIDYLALEYWWRPTVMADLLAHALEAGIEVEYVRRVIQRRNLRAPSADLTRWPYPIKITTLGRFEVVMADVPLTMSGKTQRKPLELLKYLCAVGEPGTHQELIEEALWPEADGEAAEQAFRTTLHRLRKLLRHEDAVRLADRQVSLNPSLVVLDHLAFDRMAQDADRTDTVALDRVLARYRGHFLQGETAPWVHLVRERLRARFLDLTDRLGTLLEERGQPDEAVQRYLRALDVEPTAEVMCRRVMMTYVRLGRSAEAIGIYHRFSHALRTKLGVAPSPETISLYHTLGTA